jgi:hypothetical protein
MKGTLFSTFIVRIAAILVATSGVHSASAAIICTDGFGDGDRDNNVLDSGAETSSSFG